MEQFLNQYGPYIIPSLISMVAGYILRGILKLVAYVVFIAIIVYAYNNQEATLNKATELAQSLKDRGLSR